MNLRETVFPNTLKSEIGSCQLYFSNDTQRNFFGFKEEIIADR